MKQNAKDIVSTVAGIIVVCVVIFGFSYFVFNMTSFFKPKYVALDNQVFKESQQYNDGMVRDLQNLQMEYINGDQGKKDSIRAIVLHRFSVYPEDKLSPDLRNFYNSLKAGK